MQANGKSNTMANYVNFHSQLASIMEVLANAAVAEICQLVDDGYATLRLEVSRTQRENLALKSKMRLMEARSRERFVKRTPLPHLVVSCSRRDHGGERQCISEKTNESGSTSLGNIDFPVSSVFEKQVQSAEDPDIVVVKQERLEEELKSCSTQDLQLDIHGSIVALSCLQPENGPVLSKEVQRPRINLSGLYETVCKQGFGEEEEGGGRSQQQQPKSSACGPDAGNRLNPEAECSKYNSRAHETTTTASVSVGHTEVDEQPSCSFSVNADSANKLLLAELPLSPTGDNSLVDNALSVVASIDWEEEGSGLATSLPVKTEHGLHSSWENGEKAFRTGPSLTSIPVKDTEDFQNTKDFPSHSGSAESRSSELDSSGFESSSFDELFSSPEVARALLQNPRVEVAHEARGEERTLPTFAFPNTGNSLVNLLEPSARVRAHPDRVLSCLQCGRLFSNARDLVVHQRSHAGERLFHCPMCKKPFLHLHQLKTHQRVHTGEKPFSCTQCGKRFSQSSHIKRHMSVHTGEKRYSCSLCGKRFSQSCSLKVHQSVHTGERPFSCTQCGKSFSVLGNLVRHQSVHIRK